MPEEETGTEQTQEATVQEEASGETQSDVAEVVTDDKEVDYTEATVEGFDSPVAATVDREAEDVKDDTAKPSEPTSPTGQEESPKAEEPTAEYFKNQLAQQQAHNQNLNIALHQAREKAKDTKADEENPLTEAQLRQMYHDNKNDPDTMFNIMQYQIQQGAKQVGEETINAAEVNRKTQVASQYINQNFAQLNDPTSQLRQQVDYIKHNADLDNHHMGDMAGLGLLMLETSPQLHKMIFESGKQEGLKGKAEGKRKENVKQSTTAPSGKKTRTKAAGGLSGTALETAKQMGLSDSQMKLYSGFIGKKSQDKMMEAS